MIYTRFWAPGSQGYYWLCGVAAPMNEALPRVNARHVQRLATTQPAVMRVYPLLVTWEERFYSPPDGLRPFRKAQPALGQDLILRIIVEIHVIGGACIGF